MSTSYKQKDLRSMLPEERLKKLTERSDLSNIQINGPVVRYFRSGPQIIKMAEESLNNKQYEDAFFYYMRFITLFLEKIKAHPEYKTVSQQLRHSTNAQLQQALGIAEKLKAQLREQYAKEYEEELQARKRKEEEELLQKKFQESQLQQLSESSSSAKVRANNLYVKESSIKQVPYIPDDFLVYDLPESDPVTPKNNTSTTVKKPGIDRSTKPQSNTFKDDKVYSSFLKTVVIPSRLMQTFLVLAQKNTNNNVETCGILAGRMKSNMLIVTHLLIPKQYGTSDSCNTDNEEDLFNYQSEHNLLTLGWIHTHPSQTAFLSSVDLHTHYSYQLMLSEAIAIVCAPSYNEIRFFRLTPDYGLDFIGNCRQKGFHPHVSDQPLFQDAEHCEKDDTLAVEVVDFRR
ncbi:STAM-binding protein-like A [Planococcus citri]|uniref:STAM-binding protein-like A n=1 Tax=Planococcus citri TaxID=170843 RepID=UPI0031F89371